MSTITQEDAEWINAQLDEVEDAGSSFELEVILSTDGKHTVITRTKTKVDRKEALTYQQKLFDRILERYGTKQGTAVKEYKKAESEMGGAELTCEKCGAPATARSGITKGRKWNAIFCSTDNKSHTTWR